MIIKCAECNLEYDVTGMKPGTRIRCKECSRFLTVPGGKAVACLSCGQLFSARAIRPGVRFRCSRCGAVMEMGQDGVARVARNITGSKRIQAVEEARETNGSDPGVRDAEIAVKYGAERQAQRKAPPPTGRRFSPSDKSGDKNGKDFLKRYDIRAAFLVDEDGMLLSAYSKESFDAELLSNAAYYLSGVSSFFAAQFGARGDAAKFQMDGVTLRMKKLGDRLLITVSGKPYNGQADEGITNILEQKADLKQR